MNKTNRRDPGIDADLDGPTPWWGDVATVVVLHRSFEVTAGGNRGPVSYDAGEELPLDVAAAAWPAHGDRLAAVDANGDRLDTPTAAERSPHSTLSDDALRAWREDRGMREVTRTVHVCGECGAEFGTRKALNGHQSKHTPGGDRAGTSSNGDDEDAEVES